MKKKFGLLSALVIAIDLYTKYWIEQTLNLGSSITIIPGFFDLHYLRNTGAAWSMLDGKRWFFIILGCIVTLVLLYYFLREEKPWYSLGIALMLAGTVGNLYDRMVLGYVRDMLAFNLFGYHFPVFNVADSALVIGVLILVVQMFIDEKRSV